MEHHTIYNTILHTVDHHNLSYATKNRFLSIFNLGVEFIQSSIVIKRQSKLTT